MFPRRVGQLFQSPSRIKGHLEKRQALRHVLELTRDNNGALLALVVDDTSSIDWTFSTLSRKTRKKNASV